MERTQLEVRAMFHELLAKVAQDAETDADFQSDLEGFNARIQWQLGETKGWQIFRDGKYSFEIDAELEDPDITVKFTDIEVARKLLSGESQDFLVNNFGREIQIRVAQKGFPMMKLSRIQGVEARLRGISRSRERNGNRHPDQRVLGERREPSDAPGGCRARRQQGESRLPDDGVPVSDGPQVQASRIVRLPARGWAEGS